MMIPIDRKIRAVMVDDEPKVSMVLEHELQTNFPEIQILHVARSVKEAVTVIKQLNPDVVFLDIVMPEENGFQLFNYFDNIDFEVIFVTSHSEYALNAIKVSALAYLLKPVETAELGEALFLAKQRIGVKATFKHYQVLLENLKQEPGDQKIAIFNQGETEFVRINDIISCDGWDRYTRIQINGQKEIVSSYSIGKYKALLEPYLFIECHKSFLVNSHYIKSLKDEETLVMKNGREIPIAHRKRKEVKEKLNKLKIN